MSGDYDFDDCVVVSGKKSNQEDESFVGLETTTRPSALRHNVIAGTAVWSFTPWRNAA